MNDIKLMSRKYIYGVIEEICLAIRRMLLLFPYTKLSVARIKAAGIFRFRFQIY